MTAGTLAELLLLTWASTAEQRRALGLADGGSDREQLAMLARDACVQLLPPGAVAELMQLFAPPRSVADVTGGPGAALGRNAPGLATLFGLGAARRAGDDGADGDGGGDCGGGHGVGSGGGATASGGAPRTADDMARSMLTGDLRRRHLLHRGNGDVGRFAGLVRFEIGATLALYGNCDVNFDRFSGVSPPQPTVHARWTVVCLVAKLIGLGSDVVTDLGL